MLFQILRRFDVFFEVVEEEIVEDVLEFLADRGGKGEFEALKPGVFFDVNKGREGTGRYGNETGLPAFTARANETTLSRAELGFVCNSAGALDARINVRAKA